MAIELTSSPEYTPPELKAPVINSQAQYLDAASRLKWINGELEKLETSRTRITKNINESLREINAQSKASKAPYENEAQLIRAALLAYDDAVQESARIAQEKANADAEKERVRLQGIADRASEKGQIGKAEQFESRAQSVVAPVFTAEAPKVAGISRRSNWVFTIEDESKIPREYLTPDLKKIGGVVKAMKGTTNIPGIKVKDEPILAAGKA